MNLTNTMTKAVVVLIASAAVLGFAFSAKAACTPTTTYGYTAAGMTLRSGMKGSQAVIALQTGLKAFGGATTIAIDGSYGPGTAGAVKMFQMSKGLGADGVAGPITQGALAAASATTTSCESGSGSGSGSLNGGAGDLTLSQSSANLETSVKEGASENVDALKLEADGSDIAVTSVKVTFENNSGNGSTRLSKYVDTVKVMLDGEEVGSMDASDFTKDGSLYTKSIPLDGAVVTEDKDAKLYIEVDTLDTVDDVTADFDLNITQVRFEDATGAIFSSTDADISSYVQKNFGFDDANADDSLKVKSSQADPISTTFKVDENDQSDAVKVFAYKLDVDSESSDIQIDELPVSLAINDSANTASSDSADAIIDSVTVKFDGTEYDADLDTDGVTNGDGTAVYNVSFDDGEAVIDSGSDVTVEVWVKFQEQSGNYGVGTTIQGSIAGTNIDAEGEDDLSGTGTQTGDVHTLAIDALSIEKGTTSVVYTPSDENTTAEYTINLDVTNNSDDTLYIPFDAVRAAGLTPGTDAQGISYVFENSAGTVYATAKGSASASLTAEDADIEETDSFRIESDSTETLILTVTLDNTGGTLPLNGSYRLRVTDATYSDEDEDGAQAGTAGVAQDYANLRTATKFLANA